MATQLTILNGMADKDFDRSLALHRQWGLNWLDLRDSIYGETVAELDEAKAERVKRAVEDAGLGVYCLSTTLMHDDLAKGEAHFRAEHLDRIAAMAPAVRLLRPRFFRLLAGRVKDRPAGETSITDLALEYPWLIPLYREAIDRASELGAPVTIENEARDCMLATSQDMLDFFGLLDRPGQVGLTWDIQNQWTCGAFPSLADYRRLKPLLQYVHVKGGQFADPATRAIAWKAGLQEASWPVAEIVQAVVDDGVSPVICINPSKGKLKDHYDYDYGDVTRLDIEYLRREIRGIQ